MEPTQQISKIIYFDKETIKNILESRNKGSKLTTEGTKKLSEFSGTIEAELKVKLGIPFWERLNFLFSGKIKKSLLVKKDKSTSVTSTEISEFEIVKDGFKIFNDILINDVENSSTFFRVAGAYLRIVQGGVEGVDTNEFKTVMDGQDGYDTYKINSNTYIRFNNTSFVSNYKRNDLLVTKMDIYCIYIGLFEKSKFDFMKQMDRMQNLFTHVNQGSLADAFPPSKILLKESNNSQVQEESNEETVELYDVVYACVTSGEPIG